MLLDDRELQERVGRMESLLGEIESMQDPVARTKTAEVVQTLLELYGEGLARVMDAVAGSGERERLFDAFATDELVSHLLLLHGLHPLSVEERVLRALDEVRPYLESHGGDVELLGIEAGVARLRLRGSCDGCPSSNMTLKLAIEEAVQKAAPDLEVIEAEGVAEPRPAPNFVAGPTLRRKGKRPEESGGSWTVVGGLPQLSGGGLLAKEVSGEPLVFVRLGDDYYAYRDRCPGCGSSLAAGSLEGAELRCPGCGLRFDARRAGRCPEEPEVHLEPVPLLVSEEGIVKIALASAVG
jgi:Fe-S cluster biogenesis protein NfuA/nitrite reductase/ring-hydroxylating ferredoxin subunit